MRDEIGLRFHGLFRDGSFASICRYSPTPESSEGAGDASTFAGNGGFVAALVWEVFRVRFGGTWNCGRVLVSHAGRVTVAFA